MGEAVRRLLVNDALSQLGERTFWHDLQEWFGCEFVGGPYESLAEDAYRYAVYKVADEPVSLIVRNASWFPPIKADIPSVALLQDIFTEGPQHAMQKDVMMSSTMTVFNSAFTASKYLCVGDNYHHVTIPLPIDFSVFEPGNPMGLQQALSLPDGCICWIGASQGAAGHVKGFDILLAIARTNPDLNFVAVFKDAIPETVPPNMRAYCRVTHDDLVKIIGACRVGLCTSRTESQHLAGIEMGACGLPLVVPSVGAYWKREDLPGHLIPSLSAVTLAEAVRACLRVAWSPNDIRAYWRRDFDRPVIRAQWTSLIAEIEHGAG